MKTIKFKNHDEMPILGLGTFRSQPNEVYDAVLTAIKEGYRHIDCAAIYGNESEVGDAIQEAIKQGIVKRENLWVTSKLWNNSHGQENVLPAIKKTLEDLKLDYLDLYLVHWPVALKHDIEMPSKGDDFIPLSELPISETWKGMESVLNEGLTRHIGVSNFNSKDLENLWDKSNHKPEVNQVEIHPLLPQNELLEFSNQKGIHLTAYAPIGSGGNAEKSISILENQTILKLAEEKNCSPAQIALAWNMARNISVIPKSTNKKRIAQNFNATAVELSNEEIKEIDDINLSHRFIDGKFWEFEGGPYTAEGIWGTK